MVGLKTVRYTEALENLNKTSFADTVAELKMGIEQPADKKKQQVILLY